MNKKLFTIRNKTQKETQQKGKNKHYFSYIFCIIDSNRLDSQTVPSGVAKLSQRVRRASRRKATKKKY